MANFLSLISYAISAFAMVYGLWFINTTYVGFSFSPSKLEHLLKINVTTRSDIAQFMDIGGLNKDSAYYGLNISGAHFEYDEKNDKLKSWLLSTTYKTTGIMSAVAPADARAVLNKTCNAADSQWVITDISSTFNGNNLNCLYMKDGDRYLLSVSSKPTSITAPITNSSPAELPRTSQATLQNSEQSNSSSVSTTAAQPRLPSEMTGYTDNDSTRNTRYGTLRLINKNEKITLYLNDQIFASVDASTINGFNQSFVVNDKDIVVFSRVAGGGCGTYQFISVSNRSSASMSQSFSSCGEIFFKQDKSKIFTESMDYQGENKKQVIYENGLISENNRNVPIKVSDDSCVEDKVKLFERRFEAKITRDEKSLKGEEFHLSAVRMTEIQDDARKTAVASCATEKDALVSGIPSFDCSRANQRIDQLICSNKELAALDVKLSNSFKSVRYFSKNKDAFLADSREWLAKRQQCQDASCLMGMYKNRLAQLQKIVE